MKGHGNYLDARGHQNRKYPPGMTGTEHGEKIYGTWQYLIKLPHCAEWDDYPAFYDWSMQNGFDLDMRLFRHDKTQPFSPDNCMWDLQNSYLISWKGEAREEAIARWNRTVNVLREHYGLEPFPVDEVEQPSDKGMEVEA